MPAGEEKGLEEEFAKSRPPRRAGYHSVLDHGLEDACGGSPDSNEQGMPLRDRMCSRVS